MPQRPARRRSPQWVRDLGSRELHGLTGHLWRRWAEGTATDRQEWLWEACVSELEYRQRHRQAGPWSWCVCQFCIAPFVEEEDWPD